MQVSEGDIVDAVEFAHCDGLHSADRNGAFRFRRLTAHDEGMREQYRPSQRIGSCSFGEVSPNTRHGRSEDVGMSTSPGHVQLDARDLRLEIRNPVKGDGPELIAQHHRSTDLADASDQVQAAGSGKGCPGSEPHRGIVIAGRRDDDRPRRPDCLEASIAHGDRVGTGNRAVVDVPRHDHDVDAVFADGICDGTEHTRLIGQQIDAVKGATYMPIGGVQNLHESDGRAAHRHRRSPTLTASSVCPNPRASGDPAHNPSGSFGEEPETIAPSRR